MPRWPLRLKYIANSKPLCCSRLFKRMSTHFFLLYNVVDLLGWYSFRPGLSCKHIRDFGNPKGDGEYWIDPENNGNPLKVFCDMTTDGGK